jgi:hypothetical protein
MACQTSQWNDSWQDIRQTSNILYHLSLLLDVCYTYCSGDIWVLYMERVDNKVSIDIIFVCVSYFYVDKSWVSKVFYLKKFSTRRDIYLQKRIFLKNEVHRGGIQTYNTNMLANTILAVQRRLQCTTTLCHSWSHSVGIWWFNAIYVHLNV